MKKVFGFIMLCCSYSIFTMANDPICHETVFTLTELQNKIIDLKNEADLRIGFSEDEEKKSFYLGKLQAYDDVLFFIKIVTLPTYPKK